MHPASTEVILLGSKQYVGRSDSTVLDPELAPVELHHDYDNSISTDDLRTAETFTLGKLPYLIPNDYELHRSMPERTRSSESHFHDLIQHFIGDMFARVSPYRTAFCRKVKEFVFHYYTVLLFMGNFESSGFKVEVL